jgi:hypothetical protein
LVLRQDPDKDVRSTALRALRKIGWVPEDRLSTWGDLLIAGDQDEQYEAVQALRGLGGQALPALPALIRAVEAEQSLFCDIRWRAIAALCNLGAAAIEAVPVLSKVLSDPDDFVRSYAALALYRISPNAPRNLTMDQPTEADVNRADISIFVERRINDEWICASPKERSRCFGIMDDDPEYDLEEIEVGCGCRVIYEVPTARGGSGPDDIQAAGWPRGMPVDVSAEVLAEAERRNCCCFAHSWLTLRELLDYSTGGHMTEADIHHLEDLEQQLRPVGEPEDVRIVFWLNG